MQIRVDGVHETFTRLVEVMVQQFFDQADITFSSKGDEDIVLLFKVGDNENDHVDGEISFYAHVLLYEQHEKQTYHAEQIQSRSNIYSEQEKNKEIKHVLSHSLLQVLQDYTGIRQPWGILSGIRPTKLLHRMLQSGKSKQESHQLLQDRYRITPEKINLMQRITDRQLDIVPDLHDLQDEVSLYIGIPFCPTKCAYCTFPAYDINGQQGSVATFLQGLHYEMREIGRWLSEHDIGITTVYFGGGTPTSIEAEQMAALYEEMYRSFPGMEHVREVTVEAGRPDTITPDKIHVLKTYNIDRISINPQSYTQQTLEAIGRHHTVEETMAKYELARDMGLHNINMDLIIGLPGEGLREFEHSLSATKKLRPESLTIHTLSFKRASTMTQNKAKYRVAERDEILRMMQRAAQWTGEEGYHPYYLYRQKNILGNLENVGYALPGKESIYNIMIMEEKQTIIGLGCGASSKLVHPITGKISRFANPKSPQPYNDGYQKYTQDKITALNDLYAK